MTSMRQTVTTVQTNSSAIPAALDNSLDALLEDLQTSVSRPPSSTAMNGLASSPVSSRTYREVRTAHQDHAAPDSYHHVQYMSAANPTTVVSERAVSPGRMQPGEQRSVAYKQVSYQYNTRDTQPGALESSPVSDPASDARLRQNLNELDNLLVDLHHAQKTGFSTDQVTSSGGVVPSNKSGIDSGLLEDISSTPAGRPGQHVSRVVEQRTYTTRYVDQPDSPRLQPKRSSSAQRELTYGTIEPRQESPRTSRRTVSRDVYQETKGSTPPRSQYRDKSPSNQRLHREVYYESSNKTSRMREPSPPAPKRGVSPGPADGYPGGKVTNVVRTYTSTTGGIPPSPVEPYPGSKLTTVRTYTDPPVPLDNYSTTKVVSNTRTYTGDSPTPLDSGYPPHVTTVRESPIPVDNYPTTKVTTVRTYTSDPSMPMDNYPPSRAREPPAPVDPYTGTKITTVRTYTNVIPGGRSPSPVTELPKPAPYRSPSPVQFQPPQPTPPKVTTTVRTYTYELPGDKPHHPYPPGDVADHPGAYRHQQPPPQPEREPLIAPPEPTIITYKYSSHSSHHTNTKFPTAPGGGSPDDREPLLPRPFPTASPGPGDSQPPKKLDELMASFSDTEVEERRPLPAPTYQVTERQASTPRHMPGAGPVQSSEAAAITPTPAAKAAAVEKQLEQRRGQTKNVAGPPVYYPPGVEMFARKDQSMQMASMKGSGKYEMSRESHSKSSSGGAAVVPVCLPLCCAMPCVIM